MIYVIEAENGMCKIGCSDKPESRAATVHLHSPVKTRIIAKLPGSFDQERRLHEQFQQYRGHAEWFLMKGEVADFVGRVRGINVDVIDWADISWKSTVQKRKDFYARLPAMLRATHAARKREAAQ